jgi:hypothetical protein
MGAGVRLDIKGLEKTSLGSYVSVFLVSSTSFAPMFSDTLSCSKLRHGVAVV